jgi:nitroreductase
MHTQAQALPASRRPPLAGGAPADARTGSAQAALEWLGRRYSVGPRHLDLPAPADADLSCAAGLALRAPDHGGLAPFRFVRVATGQRAQLAAMFALDAARRGHGAAEVERARARAHNGPALLALVGRVRPGIDDVPVHEQWICIGAALMNFLNALHLLGFAAKTLSGASMRAPELQRAFCAEGEELVAWIVAGTPTRAAHARSPQDASGAMTEWAPPPESALSPRA